MGIKADIANRAREYARADNGILTTWCDNLKKGTLKASDSDVGYLVVASAVLEAARNEWLEKLEKRYRKACRNLEEGNFAEAERLFKSLGNYSDASTKVRQASLGEQQQSLEKQQRSLKERELIRKREEDYQRADNLVKQKNYEEALVVFEGLESFKDSPYRAQDLRSLENQYESAYLMLEQCNYQAAAHAFEKLGDYRDSRFLCKKAEKARQREELDKEVAFLSQEISETDALLEALIIEKAELQNKKLQFDKAQSILDVSSNAPEVNGCLGLFLIGVGGWLGLSGLFYVLGFFTQGESGQHYGFVGFPLLILGFIMLVSFFALKSHNDESDKRRADAEVTIKALPDDISSKLNMVDEEVGKQQAKKADLQARIEKLT